MAEVLVVFSEPVLTKDGSSYLAQACGAERDDGLWHGWLEFTSDTGEVLRSGRETTQPNRTDLEYWATGLTPVYLEGALHRALTPPPARRIPDSPLAPLFDGPADHGSRDTADPPGILNPFSVYRKGEPLLRRQLAAFSKWHLVNIVRHYGLSRQPSDALDQLSEAELVELILVAVRERSELTT